ncbi:hypothetical protein CHS0354_004167, partial [Potamilus streckersoni]
GTAVRSSGNTTNNTPMLFCGLYELYMTYMERDIARVQNIKDKPGAHEVHKL